MLRALGGFWPPKAAAQCKTELHGRIDRAVADATAGCTVFAHTRTHARTHSLTHTHTHTHSHTHTRNHTHTHGYIEHILDIQAVLTGQEPLDASCEEPLRTARLHAGMMGEEAVTTVTDSSGNHSQKTKKSSM